MSGNDYAQGLIEISPPISWAELESHPEFVSDGEWDKENGREAWLKISETRESTSEGVLIRRTATHIRPREQGEGYRYDLYDHVEEIWGTYRRTPDGTPRTFSGEIRVQGDHMGEMTPNIWRVVMVDNVPVEERPKLLWADGTTEEC